MGVCFRAGYTRAVMLFSLNHIYTPCSGEKIHEKPLGFWDLADLASLNMIWYEWYEWVSLAPTDMTQAKSHIAAFRMMATTISVDVEIWGWEMVRNWLLPRSWWRCQMWTLAKIRKSEPCIVLDGISSNKNPWKQWFANCFGWDFNVMDYFWIVLQIDSIGPTRMRIKNQQNGCEWNMICWPTKWERRNQSHATWEWHRKRVT